MKPFINIVILVALGLALVYLYNTYSRQFYETLFDEPTSYKIFIGTVGLDVTLADSPEERKQGLSGTERLRDLEGKLFLFDTADKHGIWMKDMNYPIDIVWIDEDFSIVHIVSNASPDSYPKTIFYPDTPARYVLEVNALFVDNYQLEIGQKLTLPPGLIPADLANKRSEQFAE